ncbi:MAG: glycerate kinase [Bacteroidota bacterium]
MKILIACDKFKGSLSGDEVCNNLKRGLEDSFNGQMEIISRPIADGGDGTLEILIKAFGCQTYPIEVKNAANQQIEATIGFNKKTKTAVLEMASYVGLAHLPKKFQNPLQTSSYGLGQAILSALDLGAEKIFLGIGGSATNDGGAGMLEALGFNFHNTKNDHIHPNGGNLNEIKRIIRPPKSDLADFELIILNDVDNPICGKDGATFTYGKQKGANDKDLQTLEKNMTSYAKLVGEIIGTDVFDQEGYGAAGGIPLSACTFLSAKLVSGSEFIYESLELEELIKSADAVITGEGKVDEQSTHGKAITPILEAAKKFGKDVFIVCGIFEAPNQSLFENCRIIEISQIARKLDMDSFTDAELLTIKAGREIAELVNS